MDTKALEDVLLERLEGAPLHDDARVLVLAAFQGDAQLRQALEGAADAPTPAGLAARADEGRREAAYLRSIAVRGFRGIGPEATLELQPGPGLTLVVGRNGSGKSSFAEAAEVALTSQSYRWHGRQSRIWRDGWRNLHTGEPSRVRLRLAIDGDQGATSVERTWSGPDVDDSACRVQRPGRQQAALSSLGWDRDLATYRPFLSYSELGQLLDGRQSEMYDALAAILGVGRLADAEKRLKQVRKELSDEAAEVRAERDRLREQLAGSDDPRAREAQDALRDREPDLAALAALVSGDHASEAPAELERLRNASRTEGPDGDQVTSAAIELHEATAAVAAVRGTGADDARRLAGLLEAALDHQQRHAGSRACPVCGTTEVLDDDWAPRTQAEVERLRQLAGEAEQARGRLAQATTRARALISEPPGWVPAGDPLREAWDSWAAGRRLEDPERLAEHLEREAPRLRQTCEQTRQEAADRLARLDDRWQPLARRLGTWVERAHGARDRGPTLRAVKTAYEWLKSAALDVRNDLLRPLAKESAEVWRELRQESNVDLGPIELAGSSTQRRVKVDVTVDGTDASALGVMSQGELHALGLALFLPRATSEESPFRFLVIDDPVQSMDPAKVDGLARVLSRTAADRQVVVFTHDARLADATRRLRLPATIWEVTRREGSVVAVSKADDPISRLLGDARAAAATEELPPAAGARVVPGLCRQALEAALTEVVRSRRLMNTGARHADVEDTIAGARGPYELAALALFDDATRAGEVLNRLNGTYGPRAGDTFRACKEGGHAAYRGDLRALVADTEWLADRVRYGR